MPDPLFESRTPRLDLPLLFAGQSQKETFVNEIAARLDALLWLVVEGEAATPPVAPLDGQNWLIGANPTGDWAGRAGQVASRQAGSWLFSAPIEGMRLLNRTTGQEARFLAGWQAPATPASPAGGGTIDSEARSAITAVISVLVAAGILAGS